MKIIAETTGQELEIAGGKGRSLMLLRKYHKNVPDLFIICPESDEDIDANATQIYEAFDSFRSNRVAVRSSANVEDGHRTSFAGQFETRLNVTRVTLLEAIKYVYASGRNSRVRSYAEAQRVDFKSIRMAIIVQRQIPSDVSGVCFSRYQHNKNLGIIEACWGMGESIVSGKETPDRYIFNRATPDAIVEISIGNQLYMVSPDREVDYHTIDTQWEIDHTRSLVPHHKRLRKKLLDSEIKQVADLALQIEKEAGYICADIEFCFYQSKLYLLQARPGPNGARV